MDRHIEDRVGINFLGYIVMKFSFGNSLFSYFRLDEVSREKSAAVSEQIQTIRQLSVQNETLTQSFKVKQFFSFALFVRLGHIIIVVVGEYSILLQPEGPRR